MARRVTRTARNEAERLTRLILDRIWDIGTLKLQDEDALKIRDAIFGAAKTMELLVKAGNEKPAFAFDAEERKADG